MKRIISIFAVIILTFVMTSLLVAADGVDDQGNANDPTSNERANACYDGGTLEGKCDSPIMWQAGWYLIRFENDLLTRDEIPAWVGWVLPAEILPEPQETANTSQCIEVYTGGFQYGIFVNGFSAGGTMHYTNNACAVNYYAPSIPYAYASSQAAATLICQANLGIGYSAFDDGGNPDVYWCQV